MYYQKLNNTHDLGTIYIFLGLWSYLENLYFPVLHERTLGSTANAEFMVGNCCQAVVDSSSLLSPPLLQLSREFR
jgi:hypothetical protein